MDGIPLFGVGAFLFWLLSIVGMVTGWVIVIVALWKAMRAHEAIARAVTEIAHDLKAR